jgi:hypothetical protein
VTELAPPTVPPPNPNAVLIYDEIARLKDEATSWQIIEAPDGSLIHLFDLPATCA